MLNIQKLLRKIVLSLGDEPLIANTISFPTIPYDLPGRFSVGLSTDGNTCWMVSAITGQPANTNHYILVEVYEYVNVQYTLANNKIYENRGPANITLADDLIKSSNVLINTVPFKFAPDILPTDYEKWTLIHTGSFSNLVSSSNTRNFNSMTSASNSSRLPLIRAQGARVPTSGTKYIGDTNTMVYSYALWRYVSS